MAKLTQSVAHRTSPRRLAATVVCAAGALLWWATTASAQLDPLQFLKRVPPTVIVLFDTSLRMLDDGEGYYRDTNTYRTADDTAVASALGINPLSTPTYRRKYQNFDWDGVTDDNKKYLATTIVAVPDTSPEFASFFDATRYEIARKGIAAAVAENDKQVRWGLVKLRQDSPSWRVSPGCDKPVTISDPALAAATDLAPCNAPGPSKFAVYTPRVSTPNYAQTTLLGGGAKVVTPGAASGSAVLTVVNRPMLDSQGLIPGSRGGQGYADRPLTFALRDARQVVIDAMAADSASARSCRNSIVILVTGGKNSGDTTYLNQNDVTAEASQFMSVTSGGVTKRVPIHVLGVKPPAGDVTQLQTIAQNSGGLYRTVSSATDVSAAIQYAVQAGYSRSTQFDTGAASEFLPVSPVVGTVNLKNASSATGASLPNTDIVANPGGQNLPQRSNMLLTSGFSMPGFEGILRAFRTYVPVADSSKPTGWKFVNDGTRLWPDLDGRPWLAGRARTPADSNSRNIFTWVPDGSGGGTIVKFTSDAATAMTLRPHLNVASDGESSALIQLVRSQPLGAVIGSTPAIMDAPSLDPPPDDAYGRSDAPASFAGIHKDRRSMIFFGANDGMIHAVDARTGYEVWAFIPYNLLPKLKTFRDGQSVEQFDYFVDSSPKIAEVKLNGQWRSMLYIGQGPGGTFYQAFDVTSAGLGVAPDRGDISAVTDLLASFDLPNESISFKWSYPDYANFDATYFNTFTVTDGTPGGKVKMYGDLKSSASFAEKTVGFTWSDPAVGPLLSDRSVNAVIVGSGYFPDIESVLPARGASAPKAGNALYLLDADTGRPLGNPSGNACPTISNNSGSGSGCVSIGDVVSDKRKNALQADPTAAGLTGSPTVTKAYLGDIDGKYWRFNFTTAGVISVNEMVNTQQPIYASSALLFIGSADVYMFFATGSDLLSPSTPGGSDTFKLWGLKDNYPANGSTTQFSRNLAAVTSSGGIPNGERPSTAPSVAGDIVFYSTTTENSATPCSDFAGKIYALTYKGGAAYDSNNTGTIENNENPVIRTVAGRATAPFIVDQHLYIGTAGATGAMVEAFGDPEDFNNGIGQVGVRVLSWREIR